MPCCLSQNMQLHVGIFISDTDKTMKSIQWLDFFFSSLIIVCVVVGLM